MKTVNPSISIIVPVYKVEKYLNRCLDSIIAQTFTDWEGILIDDGSPDNCGKICDDYAKKDERFVVVHQENAGVSAARNVGLDIAKGDYIGYVDGDDWIENTMFEYLYNKAIYNNIDVVTCAYKGQTEESFEITITNSIAAKKMLFLQKGCRGFLWSKLIKSSKINDVRFCTDISYMEDTQFLFSVFSNCDTYIFTSEEVYNYYVNQESVTHKQGLNNHSKSALNFLENLIEKEKNIDLKKCIIADYGRYLIKFIMPYVYTRTYDDSYDYILSKIRQNLFNFIFNKYLTIRSKFILYIIKYNIFHLLYNKYREIKGEKR